MPSVFHLLLQNHSPSFFNYSGPGGWSTWTTLKETLVGYWKEGGKWKFMLPDPSFLQKLIHLVFHSAPQNSIILGLGNSHSVFHFWVRGGNSFANTGIMPYSCGFTHLCKYSLYQAWATQFESAICYLAVTHAQYISCPTVYPLKTECLFIVGIMVQNTYFGVIKYWVRILFLLLNSSVTFIKLLNFFQPL